MTAGPQVAMLDDGRRLHLHHGPIDLVIEVWGDQRDACYRRAVDRFATILPSLAAELVELRAAISSKNRLLDPVSQRMRAAVTPYAPQFVTPMAAVAGAVADEVLSAMIAGDSVPKAYVNNGGDIAFHLEDYRSFNALSPAGPILIRADDLARGIASSGWRGRSHSLGIADHVTVKARTAAQADVAATMIANAIDLPHHPAITRVPANTLSPDSDLGARCVTTDVGALTRQDIAKALEAGVAQALVYLQRGLINDATLQLQGQTRTVAAMAHDQPKDLAHA